MQRLLTKGIGHTEFKDTEIGRIPKSWEVKTIEDIATVKGGKRIPKGYNLTDEPNDHPYLRVADMFFGGIDDRNLLFVPEDIFPAIRRYTVKEGDAFISVAGTLGLVGLIPQSLDGANLTENADKLTDIKVDSVFLLYVLMSEYVQKIIENEATKNAQPKLALTRIRKFKVPIPSDTEQQSIQEVLSTIASKVTHLQTKKSETQTLKKGLMQKLLTGQIRVKVPV